MIKYLKYEFFKKGDFVYKHNDYGDRFYMIMRGRVSVMLSEEQLKQQQITADSIAMAAESIEDIEILHPNKMISTIPDANEESSVSQKSDLMPVSIIEEALDDTFESKNEVQQPKPVLEYQKNRNQTRIPPKRIHINDLKGKKANLLAQGKKQKGLQKQTSQIVKHQVTKQLKQVEIDPKDVLKEICRLGAG